ncbi:T9SS type A sorting domain-containing protein [Flavobacterium silvisoli]|uniref:T9SS type A sorting domain-containing protein n=1 Tax=Flavobacterium silvisoli TaxID=2529433 RepID=A0A4Q9Z9U6_9FLAO|nr:T9SS type A sorting domain-containing protein [Flavobacterium silvisoli]TBX70979.1 T9SS type A sorting domain-containing protein [Flavobacterium silvisoli]
MKKIIVILIVLLVDSLNAQVINFPDPAFKAKLLQSDTNNFIAGGVKIDANGDGEITQTEALAVYFISIQTSENITDIMGIGYFINIQNFQLLSNMLQTADLSSLSNLKTLDLGANQLTSINLNGLSNLWFMNIGGNPLTSVNFSTLSALKIILIDNTEVTNLDFSNNHLFEQLRCYENPNLSWINIRNNHSQTFTQTTYNGCWNNPNLTSICVDDNEVVAAQNFLTNCGVTQPVSIVTDCSLKNNEPEINTLAIAPNPTDGKIFFSNQKGMFTTVSVVNQLGQLVISPFNCVQGDNSVDLSDLPKGVYFLLLEGIGIRKNAKVMKE